MEAFSGFISALSHFSPDISFSLLLSLTQILEFLAAQAINQVETFASEVSLGVWGCVCLRLREWASVCVRTLSILSLLYELGWDIHGISNESLG